MRSACPSFLSANGMGALKRRVQLNSAMQIHSFADQNCRTESVLNMS